MLAGVWPAHGYGSLQQRYTSNQALHPLPLQEVSLFEHGARTALRNRHFPRDGAGKVERQPAQKACFQLFLLISPSNPRHTPPEMWDLAKPPKVGKIMAQDPQKAIILHTLGVQVGPRESQAFLRYAGCGSCTPLRRAAVTATAMHHCSHEARSFCRQSLLGSTLHRRYSDSCMFLQIVAMTTVDSHVC